MRTDIKILLLAIALQLTDVAWTIHAYYFRGCDELNPFVRPWLARGPTWGAAALSLCTLTWFLFNFTIYKIGRRLEYLIGFNFYECTGLAGIFQFSVVNLDHAWLYLSGANLLPPDYPFQCRLIGALSLGPALAYLFFKIRRRNK